MKFYQNNSDQNEIVLHVTENGHVGKKNIYPNATVVEIGKDIIVDLSILDTFNYDGWKPVHYDLMILCAVVELADRSYTRRATRWSRCFRICLPVSELAAWQEPQVQELLQKTLCYLTGDKWQFYFEQSKESFLLGHQISIDLLRDKKFTIAFSDGLDSFCVSSLHDQNDSAIRVRIAQNNCNNKNQPFNRIPFKVKPQINSREYSVRSRSFKFAAVTAIVGHICNIPRVIVPESGQGVLSPVFLPLYNCYPDYRNYPTFYRMMEQLFEKLLDFLVVYEQPQIWLTKGQTIQAYLVNSGNDINSLLNTRSCWQTRHNTRGGGINRQCGLCVACLLRRMSLHSQNIDERENTYTVSDLTAKRFNKDDIQKTTGVRITKSLIEYGITGVQHLQHFANLSYDSSSKLQRFIYEIAQTTRMPEIDVKESLRQLLSKHACEWHGFISSQGKKSFVAHWTEGESYD